MHKLKWTPPRKKAVMILSLTKWFATKLTSSMNPMMAALPHKPIFGFMSNLNTALWNARTTARNAICRTRK